MIDGPPGPGNRPRNRVSQEPPLFPVPYSLFPVPVPYSLHFSRNLNPIIQTPIARGKAVFDRMAFLMSKRYLALACFAALTLPSCLLAQAPSLAIQVDHPSAKVSPKLYGLMTEEINFSYDGGPLR